MYFISQIATKVALFQGPAQLSHYGKATEGPSGIIYHVTQREKRSWRGLNLAQADHQCAHAHLFVNRIISRNSFFICLTVCQSLSKAYERAQPWRFSSMCTNQSATRKQASQLDFRKYRYLPQLALTIAYCIAYQVMQPSAVQSCSVSHKAFASDQVGVLAKPGTERIEKFMHHCVTANVWVPTVCIAHTVPTSYKNRQLGSHESCKLNHCILGRNSSMRQRIPAGN